MEDSDDSILEVAEHSDHNTQTSKTQKKRGRPKNILWDNHFKEINLHNDGHKGWECLYCKEQNLRASDINMNTHLVLNCKKVPPNIRQELLQKFPLPSQTKKTKAALDIITGVQPQINNKFQIINTMDPGQEELSLDGWTSNRGCSYFAFVIITANKKQYVHSIKDFSSESHTAIFTANEIEKVLTDIGVDKFGAIVSDAASAMTLAKQYISNKYPAILPVRCIAHHIQLICNDIICKTLFGKKVLQQCQSFITYFHTSHHSGAILRNEITRLMINKGGLKSSVCSRWSSAYDCVQSVLNTEICIKQSSWQAGEKASELGKTILILEDDSTALTPELRDLTRNRQFWANAEVLAKILLPAKNAVKIIESKSTTTANGGIESANTLVAQIKKYDAYEPHIILLLWKKLNHRKPDNLDEIRQFDCENLEISEIIDFNAFSEERVSEVNINSNVETEEEAADYDINEVINAAI
ncbi:25061_t:CDS:2, partial [Dentiscutata erythropus]